ncbi:MAG TPA: hypothetical protein EYQ60_04795 [Myxococcales bacterium]|nr:hypothetical protein [Myxococcales bacterium]
MKRVEGAANDGPDGIDAFVSHQGNEKRGVRGMYDHVDYVISECVPSERSPLDAARQKVERRIGHHFVLEFARRTKCVDDELQVERIVTSQPGDEEAVIADEWTVQRAPIDPQADDAGGNKEHRKKPHRIFATDSSACVGIYGSPGHRSTPQKAYVDLDEVQCPLLRGAPTPAR